MTDEPAYTVETARAAAAEDDLGAWVAHFLASPGSDNAALAALLSEEPRWWIGPVEVPLDQLHRLAGPSGHPVMEEVEDHEWRSDVEDLAGRIEDGLEPPPVVVTHRRNGTLVVEDGNHRIEALRRAGAHRAWAVVGFADVDSRDRFVARSEQAR